VSADSQTVSGSAMVTPAAMRRAPQALLDGASRRRQLGARIDALELGLSPSTAIARWPARGRCRRRR
jgi:hypothetical protein